MTSLVLAASSTFQFTVTPNPVAPGRHGHSERDRCDRRLRPVGLSRRLRFGCRDLGDRRRIGNDYTATGGKVGMFTSLGVAFAIGAAPQLLQWAFGLG